MTEQSNPWDYPFHSPEWFRAQAQRFGEIDFDDAIDRIEELEADVKRMREALWFAPCTCADHQCLRCAALDLVPRAEGPAVEGGGDV